jgi:hypothetical protein
MSPIPHVPRHRTGHIRGLISTERNTFPEVPCPCLSVYWLLYVVIVLFGNIVERKLVSVYCLRYVVIVLFGNFVAEQLVSVYCLRYVVIVLFGNLVVEQLVSVYWKFYCSRLINTTLPHLVPVHRR